MRFKGEMSSSQFLELARGKANDAKPRANGGSGGNKFNAERVGDFDSKYEKSWIHKLMDLQTAGYIENLRFDKRELRYELKWNGVWICSYTADAAFDVLKDFEIPTFDGTKTLSAGEFHLLDAKSVITRKKRDYILVKNMMLAAHRIKILEV